MDGRDLLGNVPDGNLGKGTWGPSLVPAVRKVKMVEDRGCAFRNNKSNHEPDMQNQPHKINIKKSLDLRSHGEISLSCTTVRSGLVDVQRKIFHPEREKGEGMEEEGITNIAKKWAHRCAYAKRQYKEASFVQ